MINKLDINNREDFRKWLMENHDKEKECWVASKRGCPVNNNCLWYIDVVEEALCFGWIDSVFKKIDGVSYQRFTPRTNSSNWTALNLARVKRLEKLGLMSESGRKVVRPDACLTDKKVIKDIQNSEVYENFLKLPKLYQMIRINNLSFTKKRSLKAYRIAFENFLKMTKENKMVSGWDDYGRLSDEYL